MSLVQPDVRTLDLHLGVELRWSEAVHGRVEGATLRRLQRANKRATSRLAPRLQEAVDARGCAPRVRHPHATAAPPPAHGPRPQVSDPELHESTSRQVGA
ncbi:Protein of unknown function [Gryllus bimaculatus]|nr:Protein of unknown function [Gryllus bimaculatus]